MGVSQLLGARARDAPQSLRLLDYLPRLWLHELRILYSAFIELRQRQFPMVPIASKYNNNLRHSKAPSNSNYTFIYPINTVSHNLRVSGVYSLIASGNYYITSYYQLKAVLTFSPSLVLMNRRQDSVAFFS